MRLLLSIVGFATVLQLVGCGEGPGASLKSQIVLPDMQGSVYGGQQPIAGATIQLYQTGSTGYGTGATELISGGTKTDSKGHFNITGLYTCLPGTQVYITSVSGQPTPGVTNSAAVLLAGLGPCETISSIPFIALNEVTTVASVWALSPFLKGQSVGAPPTNQTGLANAFADINTLVNIGNGTAMPSTATATMPTAEINTLANSLAGCINSGGPASPACKALFSVTPNDDGTSPADVVSAGLNIARHPGRNVSAILAVSNNLGAPFQPVVSSASDFTLAITFRGSGLNQPTAAAIDGSGNVWVANRGNTLTEFDHTGAVLSGVTGFTGALNQPSAIAIDTANRPWVVNAGSNSISVFSASGSASGTPLKGGGLSSPTSISFDSFGNAWLSNSGNSSVSEFTASGAPVSGSNGFITTGTRAPVAIAANPH